MITAALHNAVPVLCVSGANRALWTEPLRLNWHCASASLTLDDRSQSVNKRHESSQILFPFLSYWLVLYRKDTNTDTRYSIHLNNPGTYCLLQSFVTCCAQEREKEDGNYYLDFTVARLLRLSDLTERIKPPVFSAESSSVLESSFPMEITAPAAP